MEQINGGMANRQIVLEDLEITVDYNDGSAPQKFRPVAGPNISGDGTVKIFEAVEDRAKETIIPLSRIKSVEVTGRQTSTKGSTIVKPKTM